MQSTRQGRGFWRLATEHRAGVFQRQVGFKNGGGISVARSGQGSPLVLVAGLSGGWEFLTALSAQLSRYHEVFMVGHRGDEQADLGPRPSGIEGYAGDLAETIESLGLHQPTVVGVSFGGAIALQLAVQNPELVGRLIVQGAEARFSRRNVAKIARQLLERFRLPGDSPFLNQFFNLLFAGVPEPGPLLEFVVRRCWSTDRLELARRLRALEEWDLTDELSQIDIPTLVIAGTRDAVVPAPQQRALAESIPGAVFAPIPDAGHIAFLTHAKDMARLITRMIPALAAVR